MGKIVKNLIQHIEKNDQAKLTAAIEKGCKSKKITLKKLEKISDKTAFKPIQKAVESVKALSKVAGHALNEQQLIECAYLVETTVSEKNPFIRKSGYDIQYDSATKHSYIHLRERVIGKGYSKLVMETVRYHPQNPKLLVAAEAAGNLKEEVEAHKKTKDLPHVIQAKAILTRRTSEGGVKTSIIQKRYSPGPLSKAAEHLSNDEQIKVAKDLLKGLKGMHERGLIHRDLKPENIFYNKETQEAVLADLGQTRHYNESLELAPSATDRFNPPEALAKNRHQIDRKKAELFSLGCTLYKMHFKESPPWMKKSILCHKVLGKDHENKKKHEAFIKKVKWLRYELGGSIKKKPDSATAGLKKAILSMLHQYPDKRPDIDHLLSLLN